MKIINFLVVATFFTYIGYSIGVKKSVLSSGSSFIIAKKEEIGTGVEYTSFLNIKDDGSVSFVSEEEATIFNSETAKNAINYLEGLFGKVFSIINIDGR